MVYITFARPISLLCLSVYNLGVELVLVGGEGGVGGWCGNGDGIATTRCEHGRLEPTTLQPGDDTLIMLW